MGGWFVFVIYELDLYHQKERQVKMEEQVKQIEKNALEELKNCAELKSLEETRVK